MPPLCIDATCGNGGDTAFLCRLVGPEGRVLGFDIQPEAIASTRARLETQGLAAELFCDSHANLLHHVRPGTADIVMFNFGWLPGADHRVFSTADSSIPALEAALAALRTGRRAQCRPLQRPGHRHRRKTEHPRLAARPPSGKIYRTGVRFRQLGRYSAPALPCSEKIAKTLASMWIFC